MKLSFQPGHLGGVLQFAEAVPEGCPGCSCLAPLGLSSPRETSAGSQNWACGSICSTELTQSRQAGEEPTHTDVGTSALLCLSKIPTWLFTQSLYLCNLLCSGAVSSAEVSRRPLQPLPAHLIFTLLLLLVSPAAPWEHEGSAGNGVWLSAALNSTAQSPLGDPNLAQTQVLSVQLSLQTAATSCAQEFHNPLIFSAAFPLAAPRLWPWQCAVWAAGCSRPRSSRCHPGICAWTRWRPPGCSHRSRRAGASSGTHPASAGFSRGHVLRLHSKRWFKTNIKYLH